MEELVEPKPINTKIIKLWSDEYNDAENDVRIPLIYEEMKNHPVLVIGLNPAYNPLGVWSTLRAAGKKITYDEVVRRFQWRNFDEDLSVSWSKLEHKTSKYCKPNYFHPIMEYCKRIGFKPDAFNVVDLYFYRSTILGDLENVVGRVAGRTCFGKEQIRLSWELINKFTPSIVLINGVRTLEHLLHDNDGLDVNDININPPRPRRGEYFSNGCITLNDKKIVCQCCSMMGVGAPFPTEARIRMAEEAARRINR